MFGYFKRKHFHVNCPVCKREFNIKFNPEEVKKYNYKYREGAGVVFSMECDFCGGESKIVQYKTGKVDAIDHKWCEIEYKFDEDLSSAKSELHEMKEKLERAPGNKILKAERNIIERKLKNLEKNFKKDKKKYADYIKESEDLWVEELKHI